jgi:hypothetical protein
VSINLAGRTAATDLIVLFTASTDYTGAVPISSGNYGYTYPDDPVNQF